MAKNVSEKVKNDDKNVGVLYTGYLEKRPVIGSYTDHFDGSYKKRFVVLTHEALHWFDRNDDDDLFGEERGRIKLNIIVSVRILDEDANSFQIESIDKQRRVFRSNNPIICEEWVSALKSTIKNLGEYTKKKSAAIAAIAANNNSDNKVGFPFFGSGDDDDANAAPEVNVLLVSHVTYANNITMSANPAEKPPPRNDDSSKPNSNTGVEIVLARNPGWDRSIIVSPFLAMDVLIISLSNGGLIKLTNNILEANSEEGHEFDVAIQNVTLASSLRISVANIQNINSFSQNGGNSSDKFDNSKTKKLDTNNKSTIYGKDSKLKQFIHNFLSLSSNRTTLLPLILSVMVVSVGLTSFPYISRDISLFVLFSIMNSIYVIIMLYNYNLNTVSSSGRKGNAEYVLRIHAHSFTSPDEPVNSPDEDIPQKFIDGCEGDMKEARRRWDITKHWRETEGLETILKDLQPNYFIIKALHPHYTFGRDKTGHIVYYERPAQGKLDELQARGVGINELYRHWLFFTEYQYGPLMEEGDISGSGKAVAVLDIEGVNMGFMSGDPYALLKKTVAAANAHYPERSHVIYVVNAPYIASMLWNMIKGMVHPNTQKKVRILTKAQTLKGLQEHIDIDQIPEYYGGNAVCAPVTDDENFSFYDPSSKDSCRFFGADTLNMNKYVRNLNNTLNNSKTSNDLFLVSSKAEAMMSSRNNNAENNNNNNNTNGAATDNTLSISKKSNYPPTAPLKQSTAPVNHTAGSGVKKSQLNVNSSKSPLMMTATTGFEGSSTSSMESKKLTPPGVQGQVTGAFVTTNNTLRGSVYDANKTQTTTAMNRINNSSSYKGTTTIKPFSNLNTNNNNETMDNTTMLSARSAPPLNTSNNGYRGGLTSNVSGNRRSSSNNKSNSNATRILKSSVNPSQWSTYSNPEI